MLNNLLATGNSGRDGELSRPKRFSLTRGQSRPDNALLSTPRAIPGSRGALIFPLETCGHAVWPEILSPDDVSYCVKYEDYYELGCMSANPPCEWSYWVDYDPDISA